MTFNSSGSDPFYALSFQPNPDPKKVILIQENFPDPTGSRLPTLRYLQIPQRLQNYSFFELRKTNLHSVLYSNIVIKTIQYQLTEEIVIYMDKMLYPMMYCNKFYIKMVFPSFR